MGERVPIFGYQRSLVQVWLLHIDFASKKNGPKAKHSPPIGPVCPISMDPIVGFWVNCPLIFDISHFFKSLVLILAQFMIIQEDLCINIGFESKKNGQFS